MLEGGRWRCWGCRNTSTDTSPVIAHDIARGSVAAYPETNGLVPLDYQDQESGTPSYKSVPVHVRRAA